MTVLMSLAIGSILLTITYSLNEHFLNFNTTFFRNSVFYKDIMTATVMLEGGMKSSSFCRGPSTNGLVFNKNGSFPGKIVRSMTDLDLGSGIVLKTGKKDQTHITDIRIAQDAPPIDSNPPKVVGHIEIDYFFSRKSTSKSTVKIPFIFSLIKQGQSYLFDGCPDFIYSEKECEYRGKTYHPNSARCL